MKQEQEPWDIRHFFKGAKTAYENELSEKDDGTYIDARNARPVSTEGHTGSLQKIKGEILLYAAPFPVTAYQCMGSATVNGHIVEFWASAVPGQIPYVRVDGIVVLKNITFTLLQGFPLQLDKNQNILGGEVFITDMNSPPMIFNIQDLIDSLTTNPTKYFSNFNIALYQVNLSSPLDIPAFIELKNVGGGGGLPVGMYQYKMRYVSDAGDRTNPSAPTPMIPVVENASGASRQYPHAKTFGKEPSPTIPTRYGIHLRFRVTNIYNYDYIEIIRTAFNAGAGIGYVPQSYVVAKIGVGHGEISVKDFIDPAESDTLVALSDADEVRQIAYVEWAKSIRYFDRRTILFNVKLASKDASTTTFIQINGNEFFPILENIGSAGYSDPYTYAYKRKYMNGERYGFAVNCFDGVGGKAFAFKPSKPFQNYQYPNRRDPATSDTLLYSYYGIVKACDVNSSIQNTHEVFDMLSAVQKTDISSFKNIYKRSGVAGINVHGWKIKHDVNEYVNETTGEIENHGAALPGIAAQLVYPYFHPYTPVRQDDSNNDGHNYIVNPSVAKDGGYIPLTGAALHPIGYQPPGFSPNYYAAGMIMAGLTGFPAWVKAFSVVRTDPAKRIIAQGIGMYQMNPAVFDTGLTARSLTSKGLNRFWFFSPDIENGIVSTSIVNDMIESPENYQIQLVSPLGFFSEMYNFNHRTTANQHDDQVDMIAYARMIRDNVGGNINPQEDTSMGQNGADGFNYIDYGKWRNTGQKPGTFNGPDRGNTLFDLSVVSRVSEGRGTYLDITTQQNIYGAGSTGGNSDFQDQGLKNFTEPFYIVNIVASGAVVKDQNIALYKPTGHYQKIESIIGQGNGLPNQTFPLVDERWDDCISAPFVTHPTAATPRYLYIKRAATGVVEKWQNVTYLSVSTVNAIVQAITTSGSYGAGVTGIYTHTNPGFQQYNFWNIVFNYAGFYPQQSDLILLRYDNTAPIRFFGGDSVVGESIFAPIDRENGPDTTKNNEAHTQFSLGIGFPYRQWQLNPRHYVVAHTAGSIKRIQEHSWAFLGRIRQMCVMFTCESRASTPFAYNNAYPLQYFPLINYVMRPNSWDPNTSIAGQNIYSAYVDAYGESEASAWKWGGFRFIQSINPDYAIEPPKEYVSKPTFGFTEKTIFGTGVMWSLQRAINVQDAPGLKTFPANNMYVIDDNQGDIKRGYSATTGRGDNLYAFTNNGICLLVTKKSILSDLTAGQLGYMAADSFISQQYWITKEIGMRDEWWRSAAEAYGPYGGEKGEESFKEMLFFANDETVYRFVENKIEAIGDDYYDTLDPVLSAVLPAYGTKVAAFYDKFNREYHLAIQGPSARTLRTFMYGQELQQWHGRNDYHYDSFTTKQSRSFGMKGGQTFELGIGYVINNNPIIFEATQMISKGKCEFIRIMVNAGDDAKPTRVEFYDKFGGNMMGAIDSSSGPLFMKNYNGSEAFIPRKDASFDPARGRMQNRVLVYKIIHNLSTEFYVISSAIQYKKLK